MRTKMSKEKVRELLFKLLSVNKEMDDKVIEEWLEQNHPKPKVVGLTDEQLSDFWCNAKYWGDHDSFISSFKNWQETKSLKEPCTCGLALDLKESKISLHQSFVSVCAERDQLREELEQLKSQRLIPNWNDAPSTATALAQDENGAWNFWVNQPSVANGAWDGIGTKYPAKVNSNWKQTLQQRPKPTPQVEVWQVWHDKELNIDVEVSDVSQWVTVRTKQGGQWDGDIEDFLARFERVGG